MTSKRFCALTIRTPICTGMLFLFAAAAATSYADGPRGYGIVAKVTNPEDADVFTAVGVSHVTAVQSWFLWSQLEPEFDDDYQFDAIRDWLMQLSPKNAVIVIMPINGKDPTSELFWENDATPTWLLDDLEAADQHLIYHNELHDADVRFPKFWSPIYQEKFGELLAALAAEFDLSDLNDTAYGETEIEYIRVTGLGISTTEPSFYNRNTDDANCGTGCFQDQSDFRAQLEADGIEFSMANKPWLTWPGTDPAGVCPQGAVCNLYKQATVDIWTLWTDNFCNVPLAVTVKFPQIEETGNYYTGLIQSVDDYFGLEPCEDGDNEIDVILHTALTTKTNPMETLRDDMNNLDSSTLKVGWGDVACTSNPASHGQCCVRLDLAREAIGWSSGSYTPVADARYITLGKSRWSNPTDDAEDVWGWADGQLAAFNSGNAPPECTVTSCQSDNGCGAIELDREFSDGG